MGIFAEMVGESSGKGGLWVVCNIQGMLHIKINELNI